MKKYLILSESMNIGFSIITHLNLNQNECYFINNSNYREIFSMNENLIVIKQDKEYKKENFKQLTKDFKFKIFKYFELKKKKEINRLKRIEQKELLRFNFTNTFMLKEGDKVFFRIKETPNNYAEVKNNNGELYLNRIKLKDIDEIIYGNIRVILKENDINYYKLSEKEGYELYNKNINFEGKEINKSMEKLLNI
jgi:hypothetical protein